MTTGETTTSWPVVVVGAGPAGLVLAWLLHRAGIRVLVIDRSPAETLGQAPKAGTVEYRVARMLEDEGLGDVLALREENHRCEFRTPQASTVVEYGALTGGRGHVVFPQHRLVRSLADALSDAGVPLWCGHTVEAVEPGTDGADVTVTGPDGGTRTVHADALVGADGAGSRVAAALADLDGGPVRHERDLPGRWLVVAAAVAPLVGHTIYGAHPRGFASHLRRGPDETRFYLEVPGDEGVADWSHDAIRRELAERLGVGAALDGARITDVGVLDLRTRVLAPMQHGGVFLVGDAAHLITPAGGKGMNLALGDAVELGHALAERFARGGDARRLAAYSATRLPVIWRAQAFSDWFLRILSAGPDPFAGGLREGWVDALGRDPLLARWFAHAYAGVDPDPA
jgi:p-hydroxybenzoate 3-monooxygenase